MRFCAFKWLLLAGSPVLAGCASGPPPAIYVLSPATAAIAGVVSEAGRPVVELRPVLVPDYLDTTDILLRDGQNELKSSATGHWGERLSVGVTRTLAAALTRRLPGVVVTETGSSGAVARTLLVNVEAFDISPDGHCVLAARWTILGDDRHIVLASERATIVTAVPRSSGGVTDTAIVAAMEGAVEQLADHVASDLSRAIPGHGTPPIARIR